MNTLDTICRAILAVFTVLLFHRSVYLVVGFLFKAKKYPPARKNHRYAFVIAARNEENVIGNLLDSIAKQDYPKELIKVYVVADNCADDTARIAREKGATVYERRDPAHARKGYAMEYLFDRIARDDGIDACEGYFVFDADNLLAGDFVARMNEAYDAGRKIVTAYRNTKNFDTNWVSSAYAIHFYENSMSKHRPRSLLGVGTHLTGTGYLIDSSYLAEGWHFTSFTEDDQITMATAGQGEKIAYCEAAEFFDEQPVDFLTSFRQRVRWAKGRLTNFFRYGHLVGTGIFRMGSFTCYDMFTHYFPYTLFSWVVELIYPAAAILAAVSLGDAYDITGMLRTLAFTLASQYLGMFVSGLTTVIRERKHIRCALGKLILYLVFYPWFSFVTIPVYLVAIFSRVTWTPIVHGDARRIEDLQP